MNFYWAWALIAACPLVAHGQYSIDWFTIDGGGGQSRGGSYDLSASIGQPDAGTMRGGSYILVGGFWGIITAIQTPGSPLLEVLRTGTNTVMVSWPSPSTGFSLQQATDLTTSNWIASPGIVSDNGTNRFIIVSPLSGNRLYRLWKP